MLLVATLDLFATLCDAAALGLFVSVFFVSLFTFSLLTVDDVDGGFRSLVVFSDAFGLFVASLDLFDCCELSSFWLYQQNLLLSFVIITNKRLGKNQTKMKY